MRQEMLIKDPAERVIDGKVSTDGKKGYWNLYDYELEGVGAGRAIACYCSNPGELTIRLGASGRCRISFITQYNDVRAKLTGDDDFTTCTPVHVALDPEELKKGLLRGSQEASDSVKEGWCDVEEVVWREDDLTGKDLVIDDAAQTCVMAIRVTPVVKETDNPEASWPIAVTVDSGLFSAKRHMTPDDLFEIPELIPQDSNVRKLFVQVGCGDLWLSSFTSVGTEFGEYGGPVERKGEANMIENLRQYHQWGVNPMNALAEYAHRRGWELHVYVRLRGASTLFPPYVPVLHPMTVSKFCGEHPEYSLQDRNGTRVEGFSVAYPEVRQHLCKLYAELAGYGVDGVNLCFIRGCPVVLYEPAMVECFVSKHRRDPRRLRDDDPEWLDYKAEVVNTWMREIKAAHGIDCKLSAMVNGTPELNRRFGLDIATWVKEGIVSDLIITGQRHDKYGIGSHGWPEDLEYDYFQDLPGRDKVQLWPMFYPWQQFDAEPERFYAALQSYVHAGADGYALWDGPAMHMLTADNPMSDLAKVPSRSDQSQDRLLGKHEVISWCGYRWNRHSPMEGW